jgi:phosphatidylglycerophosphatase C
MTTIAAFDFDATLTRRDSVIPFLARVVGITRLLLGLATRPHRVLPALVRRDRDALRALATDVALRGVGRAEFDRHAEQHAAAIIEGGLRADTTARLRWHRDQGHRVVIVSASYEYYVRVVGDHLGVDEVLATRTEFDGEDCCTGRLAGANCRAEEKVRRLEAWLEVIGVTRDQATIWAYGDSNGDRAMLEFADHPVWVTEPLASVAATARPDR